MTTMAASRVPGADPLAGVSLVEIVRPAEASRAAELLREVWRTDHPPMAGSLVVTVQHVGGYAFGAYDGAGALLAVSIGLLATSGLHSHITGVAAAGRRRGLGRALKQHQREWALERGLTSITWTCDPLVRRNVQFNLTALGATAVDYLPDHYGPMEDGLNAGDESDRLAFAWDLLGPGATAAMGGRVPFRASDLPVAVSARPDGTARRHDVPGSARLVQLPPDVEALRRDDPPAARDWRLAVREAVLPALAGGARITGLTATGQLVLEVGP